LKVYPTLIAIKATTITKDKSTTCDYASIYSNYVYLKT